MEKIINQSNKIPKLMDPYVKGQVQDTIRDTPSETFFVHPAAALAVGTSGVACSSQRAGGKTALIAFRSH